MSTLAKETGNRGRVKILLKQRKRTWKSNIMLRSLVFVEHWENWLSFIEYLISADYLGKHLTLTSITDNVNETTFSSI
jgi:hypothetical protein